MVPLSLGPAKAPPEMGINCRMPRGPEPMTMGAGVEMLAV